jgi:hypothetical protein
MSKRAHCPSRPLLLLSARRRAALRDVLIACIDSWRARWSTVHDPLDLTIPYEAEHAGPRAAPTIALTFTSREHGDLGVLHSDADFVPALLGVNAVEAGGAAHGVAREFLIEMMHSLCSELAKRAHVSDAVVEAARISHATNVRLHHLPVAFRTGHSKARVVLWLSAHAVELLAPPAAVKPATSPVVRRRQAVAPERVKLEAVLGSADVCLRDLVQLAVGDVIVLDQPLTRGGHLAVPYGRIVAQVVLGRSGGRRAVSIATQSEQRSEHP